MALIEFTFSARNKQGKMIKGKVKASSEMDVRTRLRDGGFTPVSVKQKGAASHSGLDLFAKSVDPKDFQIFLRQLSVLLKSGVPLLESLESLEESALSPALSRVIKFLIDDIKEGKTLSDAMSKHPKVFPTMVVNLVKAGEQGGILDEVLDRLGAYFEKRKKLKAKVTGALMYPVITIFVALGALTAILVFVIPKFEDLFKSNGQDLPALTRIVVDLSHSFTDNWYFVILFLVVIPMTLSFLYKTGPLTRTLDAIFLKIPVFGDLIKRSAVARMSRTLSTLLKAGIRINDGIDITIGTMGNVIVDEYMIAAKEAILAGKPFSEPLKQANFFPVIVIQMVSIGEKTGNLDSMLEKVADFYEDEVEQTAEQLTAMLEPIVIVFLGGMIGTLVVAMFMPIFSMADAFG